MVGRQYSKLFGTSGKIRGAIAGFLLVGGVVSLFIGWGWIAFLAGGAAGVAVAAKMPA